MGRNPIFRFWIALILAVLLSACVRPIEPTPTPAPTATTPPITPTPPSLLPSTTFPVGLIGQWLQTQEMVASNLTPFTQVQVGPDEIVGYVFQDPTGQRCVGWIIAIPATQEILSGDYRCAPTTAAAVTGTTILALTNNEPYVIAYGYVDPNIAPTANAIAVVFPNGTSLGQLLTNRGFVVLQPGLITPTSGVIMDANENTVANVTFQ